ncbi:LOW QUALITY PROTEIN: hypothetical protein ACHAWF_000791, partial [Thalassiosira exigua]
GKSYGVSLSNWLHICSRTSPCGPHTASIWTDCAGNQTWAARGTVSPQLGVLDDNDVPADTHVDDDLYAEIYDAERIKQAIATSIEAIFILYWGNLAFRQDPISIDKLEDMMVNYTNLVLGRIIIIRTMRVQPPLEYISATLIRLCKHWHKCRKRSTLSEIETLAGKLGYIADTAPWLRFLMAHVYTSIAGFLKISASNIIDNHTGFRDMIKTIQSSPQAWKSPSKLDKTARDTSYAQSTTTKMIHHSDLYF